MKITQKKHKIMRNNSKTKNIKKYRTTSKRYNKKGRFIGKK